MNWFYKTVFYRIWSRILTWFGDLYFATQPPKVKGGHMREAQFMVQRGDIVLRKYIYYLDSYFIKGKYSHSGVVRSSREVIHAVAEGVSLVDFLDFIKDTDGFAIIRPKYQNENFLHMAMLKATQILRQGAGYDFLFNKGDKSAFYCHEFSATCLEAGRVKVYPKNKIIYAEDLQDVCELIYEADV